MVYRDLHSRARDVCFTALCVLTVLLAAAAGVLGIGVLRQANWARGLQIYDKVSDVELVAGAVAGGILAILALIAYILSLDVYRARRPAIRLYLLWASVAGYGAAVILAPLDDTFLWLIGGCAVAVVPLPLLGLERLAGAGLIAFGRHCYRKEWWEFSCVVLRLGMRFYTTSRAARRDYGMALRTLGDVASARRFLEPLYESGMNDEALVETLCQLAVADRDWEAAVKRYETLRAVRPEDRNVLYNLALALTKLGRHDSARELIESVPAPQQTAAMLGLLEECYCALRDLAKTLAVVARRISGLPYEKARERYERLMESFPGEEARICAAVADMARDRRQTAEEARWLTRVVDLTPDRWEARRRLVGLYHELGRPDLEALHLEALATRREEPEADDLIRFSRILDQEDKNDRGMALVTRYAQRFAGDARFTLEIARHDLGLGNLDTAEREVREALELLPEAEQSEGRQLARRIEKAIRHRRLEEAHAACEAAPGDVDLRLAYIAQLVACDEIETAVRELDRLLTRNPSLKTRVQSEVLAFIEATERPFLILSYLSDLALQDRDFDRALALYEAMAERSLHPAEIVGEGCRRILSLQPGHLAARATLGLFHASREEWAPALETLTPYFANGGEHNVRVDRAMFDTLCQLENVDGAVEYAERALAHDCRDASCLVALARLYESKGRHQEAAETLRRALTVDDRDLFIYDYLREIDSKIKEERYFELKDELDADPKNPALNFEMGEIYMQREQYIQAVKHFQIGERDPALANLCRAKQAACLSQRRMFDLAEEQLDEVVVDPADETNIREIKRLLYTIAATYEQDKHPDKAFAVYKRVFRVDAGFRDVAQKVEELA